MLKPDGTLTPSQQETVQAWLHHFREISNPSTREDTRTEAHCTANNTRDDYILNTPITFEEAELAVAQLEESKAPGLDRICPSTYTKG